MSNILTSSEKAIFDTSITDLYDTFGAWNKYGTSIIVRNVATEVVDAFNEGTYTYNDYTYSAVVRDALEVTKTTLTNSVQHLDIGLLNKSDYFIKLDSTQANSDLIDMESVIQLNASELVETNKILLSIIGISVLPNRIHLYCTKQAR